MVRPDVICNLTKFSVTVDLSKVFFVIAKTNLCFSENSNYKFAQLITMLHPWYYGCIHRDKQKEASVQIAYIDLTTGRR
jgi:hypothetical protein